MLKKRLQKFMPNKQKIMQYKFLKIFGKLLHANHLWHLNRCSTARAFAVGLFCAWMPIPFQMVPAAAGAILFKANLPLSIALVWITNPATMPPLFFFAYKVGTFILNIPTGKFQFELSFEWLATTLNQYGQPFLLGCFVCGMVSSTVGYFVIKILWRYHILKSWRERRQLRREAKALAKAKKMQAKSNMNP